MTDPTEADLRAACELVERYARSIGPRCEVILMDDLCVQVAPVEWAGCVTGPTLFDALTQAHKERDS
jgi:hypothetical protein